MKSRKKPRPLSHHENFESDNYKWGFLYYDPSDHRIIVPKRIAWMGWTLNFANPFSYIIIACIIVVAILLNNFLGSL